MDLLEELMGDGFPERGVEVKDSVGIVGGFAFVVVWVMILVGTRLGHDWHFFGSARELSQKLRRLRKDIFNWLISPFSL